MEALLPIHRLNREIDLQSFLALEFNQFRENYLGEELRFSAAFAIGISRDTCYFGFETDLRPSESELQPGTYHEGLWNGDVAELFLSTDGGYTEINLAPSGAWWSCRFESARKRAPQEPTPLHGVQVLRAQRASGWKVALSFPLCSVGGNTLLTGNVTAILGVPRTYLSWAPLPARKLDFHQPSAFLQLAPAGL